MRVALIGARGSGKTDMMDGIYGASPEPRFPVDGYVERFQQQTDLAVAQYATYIVNMQIAMERLNCELFGEREIKIDGGNLNDGKGIMITCGTLLDTTIYLAIHAANMAASQGPLDINIMNDIRSNATMHWFGMMRADCWFYDHAFYLPLGDRKDPEVDHVAAIFDDYVLEAAEAFQIPIVTLNQPTYDDKLSKVLETIYV